jgi:hypothetical protein
MSVDLGEIAALRERAKQACKESERLRTEYQQIYNAIDESRERIKNSRFERASGATKSIWILALQTCAKG